MRKLVITLATLVLLLAGFITREFMLAPDNFINYIKGERALKKAQKTLLALYGAKGEAGVEERCAEPIEMDNYWFTCRTVHSLSYETGRHGQEETYFVSDVMVFRWKSEVEAKEIATFQRSSSGQNSMLYRVGTTGTDSVYYLNAQHWAQVDGASLQKRLARPEDMKRKR